MTEERIKRKVFDSLPEYSISNPSGTTVGKVWKRNINWGRGTPEWIICEYVSHPNSKLVGIDYRRPVIVEE